jgi:hypothetical protein
MKSFINFDCHGWWAARQLQELISIALSSATAAHYWLAAWQDAKNGF